MNHEPPILQVLNYRPWNQYGLDIKILRDDLIHPFVSGNKWRKLKYNIEDFRQSGKTKILTFGGAYSNHLVATAAASRLFKFNSTAIIRGEEVSNDYILFLKKCGMKLHFINRSDYRKKNNPEFIADYLLSGNLNVNDYFIIPEGGSNESAVKGVSEINNDIGECDYVICACGTGATLSGIARTISNGKAVGISVLKAEGYIQEQVLNYNQNSDNCIVLDNYHLGGYAKSNETLLNFCKNFTSETGIPLEPVYTGKMIFAVDDLIHKQFFKKGDRIVLVHTGGIFDFKTHFPK